MDKLLYACQFTDFLVKGWYVFTIRHVSFDCLAPLVSRRQPLTTFPNALLASGFCGEKSK
jgi:hypothetical protein